MDKICFKCLNLKTLSDFYKHPRMADGHLNKCKNCAKADAIEIRKKNVIHYREYDKLRGNRQTFKSRLEHKKRNLIAYAARTLVGNAIRDGKLLKKYSCEICQSTKSIHAHHDDYSKPLCVRWLCAACHSQWHKKNGPGLNSGIKP